MSISWSRKSFSEKVADADQALRQMKSDFSVSS